MKTCEKCGRRVSNTHTCNGDARSTCVIYGCGAPSRVWRLREIDGTGRRAMLGYCDRHVPT